MDTDKLARFSQLLHLYQKGNISPVEQDEFFALIATHQFDALLEQEIDVDFKIGFEGGKAELPPHISQEIIRNILSAERAAAAVIPIQRKRPALGWVAAAVLVAAVSLYYFINDRGQKLRTQAFAGKAQTMQNSSDTARAILLSDGSRVVLDPHSTLYFPQTFADSVREVYLDGRAFFEVTHIPGRPFLVYSDHIITKVLGTSFYVNTHTTSGNEEVSVKTGRVQVFENTKANPKQNTATPIIITPNQKAVYEPEKRFFETTIVDKPAPILKEFVRNAGTHKTQDSLRFNYDQERLENILLQLDSTYGIEIIPENPSLNNCIFTGDLSGDDLFTKLKILCLTTQSSYEINGTRILIKGSGCK
jgi:hypothetical protein